MPPALRKTLKWLLWFVLGLFGLALLLVLAFVVRGQFDEDLSPEAKALLDYAQHQPLPPEKDNAYFAMLGFNAPSGQDMGQIGHAYWEQTRQFFAQYRGKTIPENEFSKVVPEVRGLLLPDLPTCNKDEDKPCLAFWSQKAGVHNLTEVQALASRYAEALQRYQSLQSYSHFAEPLLPDNPIGAPTASILSSPARHLWLLVTGWQLAAGDATVGLGAMERDLHFWVRQGQLADTWINKMIATALVRQDYELLVQAAYRNPAHYQQNRQRWLALLAPLPSDAQNVATVQRHEAAQQALLIATIRAANTNASESNTLLFRLTYKPQASMNMMLRLQDIPMATDSIPALQAWQKKHEARVEQECGNLWNFFYNSTGRILQCIAQPDMAETALRLWRTEALRRLSLQALELLDQTESQNPQAIAAYLAKAPTSLRNPWDQQPARYDAMAQELIFAWAPRHNGRPDPLRLKLK